MVVLALLAEEPMHVYRMHQLIRERAKDDVVNIGSRNSIHQVVERLARNGLVQTHEVEAARGRTSYRLTKAGGSALREWLAEGLERPRNEYPEFPAVLAFAALLSPAEVSGHLQHRIECLDRLLAGPTPGETARQYRLHRVFVIEDEYRREMLEAELAWVRALVTDLLSGALAWPPPPGMGEAHLKPEA